MRMAYLLLILFPCGSEDSFPTRNRLLSQAAESFQNIHCYRVLWARAAERREAMKTGSLNSAALGIMLKASEGTVKTVRGCGQRPKGSAVVMAQEIDKQKSLAQIKQGIFRNYIDEPTFQVYFLFICCFFYFFDIKKTAFQLSPMFEMAEPSG